MSLPWRLTTVQLSIIFSTGRRQSRSGFFKRRFARLAVGQEKNSKWEVLDSNSASDGDVWMPGHCWRRGVCGKSSVIPTSARVAKTYRAGGSGDGAWAGFLLLPGKVGFAEDNSWRFNPSTCRRRWRSISPALARRGLRWRNQSTFIAGNRPERLFARLVRYEKDKGWQLKAEKTLISSTTLSAFTCG